MEGHRFACYQTRSHPVSHLGKDLNGPTLKMLWILRTLPYGSGCTYCFCVGCAQFERGQRYAGPFGKVAGEYCVRKRLSQENTSSGEPCDRAHGWPC